MTTPNTVPDPTNVNQLPGDGVTTFSAADGGDHVEGDGEANRIVGGDGGDALYGYGGNDTIEGGGGSDHIEAGEGDDSVDGGEGHDTLFGGGGNDTLVGGAGNDNLAGHGDDDVLQGGIGDDILEGGAGNDTLEGGTGNDTLYGDGGADTFVFEADNGADVVGDFSTTDDTIDLSAFTSVWSFDDLLLSSTDDGVLIDLTPYGGGTVVLEGVALADLDATHFVFSEGLDGPANGPSSTWHMGSQDADSMLFGDADDLIMTITGDDVVDAGAGNDSVHGGHGNDIVSGSEGDDELYGYWGDDVLRGGDGADTLDGEHGNDTLLGGAGDDVLDGGFGDDLLVGGSGSDTFVVTGPSGNPQYPWVNGADTVRDFADGEDVIDLSQLSEITGFSDLAITADGTSVVIDLSTAKGGTLRLENVSVDELDASDFVFAGEGATDGQVDGM